VKLELLWRSRESEDERRHFPQIASVSPGWTVKAAHLRKCFHEANPWCDPDPALAAKTMGRENRRWRGPSGRGWSNRLTRTRSGMKELADVGLADRPRSQGAS